MGKFKERQPDIVKYCLNCGKAIERKRFGERIEDFAKYQARKFCNRDCYLEMRAKNLKKEPRTKPPEPPPSEAQSFPIIEPEQQLSAEEYLMRVMNDHSLPAGRRDNAAKLLITAKTKAPAKNKKEERADAATSVATGNRFAPSPPPLRAVGGRG